MKKQTIRGTTPQKSPRIPQEMRDKIHTGGAHHNKKKYTRHQKHQKDWRTNPSYSPFYDHTHLRAFN